MYIHGDSYTRLYKIYKAMKIRCYGNSDKTQIKNYKNRGITVCDEWLNSWIAFKTWAIENGYNDTLTIDRINNNKGYSPDNCRWATRKEQNNNKRTNFYITINDITHTMTEWCEINNINIDAACKRIETYGWNPIKAVTTPTRTYERYGKYSRKRKADERAINGVQWQEVKVKFNGETHNVAEWSRIVGIGRATIAWRLKNGWSIEDALTKPTRRKG